MRRERRLGRGLAGLLGGDDDVDVVDPPADTLTAKAPKQADSRADSAATIAPGTPSPSPANDVVRPPRPRTVPAKPPINDGGNSLTGGSASKSKVDAEADGSTGRELLLSINLIEENPFQPRREFLEVEIASLAESLKDHDMLQPVLVRRMGKKYQLISGERRLRAARLAGWKKIPARIREADDRLVAELAIVENLQRKDLSPIEKALSFQRYLDEHDCRQEDLAKRLKIDRSTIANLLRLLELPAEVRRELQSGSITAGHARALLPLGDRRRQIKFCNLIKIDGLSVRAIEQLVSESVGRGSSGGGAGGKGKTGSAKTRTNRRQIASLEKELRRALGTKVEIKAGASGSGKISIHFKNHSEFERIRDVLSG